MHVVFPGSFDPVTNGHLNIISRCSTMFSKIDVLIANHPDKKELFTPEERKELLENLLKEYSDIEIFIWDKLTVDFLKTRKSNVIVRGVRTASDYEYEFGLAQVNKGLGKGIETIFLPTDEKYFVLRSSVVKEIVLLGGDVSDKVPPPVLAALRDKLEKNK